MTTEKPSVDGGLDHGAELLGGLLADRLRRVVSDGQMLDAAEARTVAHFVDQDAHVPQPQLVVRFRARSVRHHHGHLVLPATR